MVKRNINIERLEGHLEPNGPNGTRWMWVSDNSIQVLTWHHYNTGTGEYYGTQTDWEFYPDVIECVWEIVRRPYESWFNGNYLFPKKRHKQIARAVWKKWKENELNSMEEEY